MKRFFIISALIACILIAGCTTTPSLGTGTLQFSSSPPGAQVYLDNQYQGTTPSTLSGVSAGPHSLEYRDPGYQSYITNITVTAGTSSYYAALTPASSLTVQPTTIPGGAPTPVSPGATQPVVTIQATPSLMIVGGSEAFTGTCTANGNVLLVLYGPGAYTNGVQIAQVPVGAMNGATNVWSYTWNPGNRVVAGQYTMIAYDSQKISSASATFSVVGGGSVSILASPILIPQGATITFSGTCSTGATSVILTLYGPGQYTNGVTVATIPLNADNTWSYRYTFDLTKPTGTYTMSVSDVQNTATSSVLVTVRS